MKPNIQSALDADPAPSSRFETVRAELRPAGADPTTLALIVLLAASIVFLKWPGIDLAVSDWFYTAGQGFALKDNTYLGFLRKTGKALPALIAIVAFVLLVTTMFSARMSRFARPAQPAYLLATLAVGPGLIVNGILKQFWGRARPRDTLEFGGEWPFTPAWVDADYCSRNCSFVSGEASASIWLVALVFIVPKRLRMWTLAATLPFAVAVSFNRVLYGAHFFSDIVIAWAIMLVILTVAARLILDRPPLIERRLEQPGSLIDPARIRRLTG